MQILVTPSAGKRLIAKALLHHPDFLQALRERTVVIVAGTTNGYIAEEVLQSLGQSEGFDRCRFFRGVSTPPTSSENSMGRLPDQSQFLGDVVIEKGKWIKGKTIFDVVDSLQEGDVILKGGNALDLTTKQAAILIGHPKGGTILAALQAVIGRRVRLLIPIGLEKRVHKNLYELARTNNLPGQEGFRFLPIPGEVITELEAISLLTGLSAELLGGGGVLGAEGAVWLLLNGTKEEKQRAHALLQKILEEPPFSLE